MYLNLNKNVIIVIGFFNKSDGLIIICIDFLNVCLYLYSLKKKDELRLIMIFKLVFVV